MGKSTIRVAVVDDHHVVRLGLAALLESEPGMQLVGAATSMAEAAPLIRRTAPDVVIVDYRLPDGDGLTLCQRIKQGVRPPAVILHSAFADETLSLAAVLAGADRIVHKGAPGRELAEAIRNVASGAPSLPTIDTAVIRAGGEVLDAEDLPILGMLVHGTSQQDVANTLRIPVSELRDRLQRMLNLLRAPSATR